jgi:hypothetical protein
MIASFMGFLNQIWSAQIQIVPILLTILAFEIVAIFRRFKKLYYVPIYFSVFPLSEINEDLSTYLAEDYFFGHGKEISRESAELIRKRIIVVSLVSMAIGALLTPLVVGFISAFYMPKEVFFQFLSIFILYKSIRLLKSILDFHSHSIGSRRNLFLLGSVYVCYLGVVFEVLRKTYYWAAPYVKSEKWVDMLSDLSNLVFGQFVIGVVLLALLTTVFVNLIADRKLRENTIDQDIKPLE